MRAPIRLSFITLIFVLSLTFITCEVDYKIDLKERTEASFAIRVVKSLPNLDTMNHLFSPSSLYKILAIMRIGAKKQTATDLKKEFSGSTNDQVTNKIGKGLNHLTSVEKSRSFYFTRQKKIQHKFRERLDVAFGYKAQHFKELTTADVNNLITKNTNNRVQNFLNSSDIVSDNIVHVVVDILSFKAKWLKPFKQVLNDTWINDKNERYDVKTYQQHDTFLYGESGANNLDARFMVLPFADNQTEMLIILPNEKHGLDDLLKKLERVDITKIKSRLETQKVIVYFPELKQQFSEPVQKVIETLDGPDIFTVKGNFDNLSWLSEKKITLSANKLKQQAIFGSSMTDVSALAVTSVQWEDRQKRIQLEQLLGGKEVGEENPRPTTKVMDIDHPFFYAIVAGENILFAGTIRNFGL